MAKVIIDIHIEQGYPYTYTLDMNDADGNDLETDYSCWFYSEQTGAVEFDVNPTDDGYNLTLSATDTDKLTVTSEEYVIYTIKTSDSSEDKLVTGRMHIDFKVRT